jgi:superfamily II DNA or RNA helicase
MLLRVSVPAGRSTEERLVLELRDYQTNNVTEIRAAFAQYRRVLFVLPTGGGKTVIFAFITTHASGKGKRVTILAHRQEIAEQISLALTAMGVAHGRIQPRHQTTDDLVQVGMVQTVARRLADIAEPALLVIDEAHHAVAGTWRKIADAWPQVRVLGVTATPERLDGVGLRDAFDVLVLGPDVRELIDGGHLASFRYPAPSNVTDLSSVRTFAGDFNAGDLERVIDRDAITGDVVEHYLKHLAPRTAIAFCVTVAHAEHVARRFRDAGIQAASIDGSMSADERRDVVEQLRTGDIRVLASCEIISEGFDAPAVGGCILLRPTQSFALYRQQVGRCLRPKDDGSTAIIVDHVANVWRHGLPDAPHIWSLDSQRRTFAERQRTVPGLRKCRVCSTVFAAGARGHDCGVTGCLFAAPDFRERAGSLEKIISPPWAHGIDIRHARGPQWYLLLQYAGTNRARLREIQAARGYKPGWVRYAAADAERRRAVA